MAYFDCIVGGSGKGNTLVVTCADDLAGATITCTNGTKTYTKTCPSTAPYEVTFYGLAAGTWTVSATVSGDTYTTTVVITDYEAELGGFSWRAWVDLSKNYTSSDFTDLDDLLDTELAVRELMSIHACVDYLAGIATESTDVETIINNDLCAKWINNRDYALDTLYANTIIADYMDEADKYFYGEWVITDNTTTPPTWGAKGNVPIMTANNAPYGTVTRNAVTQTGGGEAYCAFDGNDTTFWRYPSGTGDYIRYQFTNPVCIKKLYIKNNGTGTTSLSTQLLRVSKDGTNFTSLNEILLNKNGVEVDVNNDDYVLYAEVKLSNYVSSDGSIGITTLQFYGRELSVSVPKMTGNTTPYGEANAYREDTDRGAWRAFDGDDSSTNYYSNGVARTTSDYLQYKFTNPTCVKRVRVKKHTASSTLKVLKIRASHNGTDFVDLGTIDVTSIVDNSVDINNSESYLYYRIQNNDSSSEWMSIDTVQFYGLDYSEKEFEEGTSKKWLYDHGLELETLTFDGSSSYKVLAENDGNDIHLKSSGGAAGVSSALAKVTIDLTSYSLIRCKVGNVLSTNESGGRAFIIVVYTIGSTTDNKAVLQVLRGSSILPNNLGLDISSINGRYDLDILDSNNGGAESKVSEWWLE